VKEKLESIQELYNIVVENFSISNKDRMEWLIIFGWIGVIILELLFFVFK